MLAKMQNSANNLIQILAISVRTIFHISGRSNHEGMTTARQKINVLTNRLRHISWGAALEMRKRSAIMNGSISPCSRPLKIEGYYLRRLSRRRSGVAALRHQLR